MVLESVGAMGHLWVSGNQTEGEGRGRKTWGKIDQAARTVGWEKVLSGKSPGGRTGNQPLQPYKEGRTLKLLGGSNGADQKVTLRRAVELWTVRNSVGRSLNFLVLFLGL